MKKVLAALLAMVLVITGLYIVPNSTKEVQAAKTTATGEGLNLYQTEYEWYYSRDKKLERLPDTFEVTYRLPQEGFYRPGNILGNGRYESSSTREPDNTFQIGFFQGIVPYLRITDEQTRTTTEVGVNHGKGGHFYMFGEYEWPSTNVAPYVPSRADAAANEAYAKYVTQYDEYVAKFCTGEWIHLAIVNDVENNQMHCYVNGELFKTINECYTGSATFKTDQPLYVFGDHRGQNTQQFRGDIKNVALYSDVRTAGEIQDDKTEVDGTEEGLMAAYNMDLGTDGASYPTKIDDLSSNGYDLYEYFNDCFMSEAEKESLAPRGNYAYSMAVVGDPQIVTRDAAANSGDKNKLNQMYQWIVDHTEEKNIQFTFHMGDSIDSYARATTQWPKAKEAADVWNNAGIRYSMVRGNHDSVTDYLANYDWDTYKNKVDGSYAGNMLNTYQKFTVGDIKYLVVNLDFGAEDAALEWACDVVEANPEYNVIVTTHGYLDETGKLLTTGHGAEPTKASGEGYAEDNDGVDIWNKFISKYENITLVLSGHVGTEQVVMNQREGKNGHKVTEMLINPQLTDRWLGLNGIVTMLYFSEDGKTVKVENYCVLRDASSDGKHAYYDIGKVGAVAGTGELASHFTMTLDTVSNTVFDCESGAVALTYDKVDRTGTVPKSTLENYKDYLFAGWYTSPSCTMDTAIKDLSKVTAGSYAKFIPADMLSIKAQTAQQAESNGDYLMRFISSVEGLNYSQVGFEVTYVDGNNQTKTKSSKSDTVYERIASEYESITYAFGPKVVDTVSEYFVTARMYADPNELYTVRAYYMTLDGTVVYGPYRCVAAKDGLDSATDINLSFEAKDVSKYENKETITVTYGAGNTATTATVLGINGSTVHVRVKVSNMDSLLSVTKFTFEGGESVTWRNLYTTHKTSSGSANADTSWYTVTKEVYPNENEFVIATTADLYGFSELVTGGNNFLDQATYLCAELTVNENTPKNAHLRDSWSSYTAEYAWNTIGNDTKKFAGTFDGQGHSIQGIYISTTDSYVGFFGHTSGSATIRDFKLTDSYIQGKARIGSITGNGGGTFFGIYSDAIAYASSSSVGGVIGYVSEAADIRETQFEGSAESSTQYVGGIIGRIDGVPVQVQNVLFSGVAKALRTSSGFGNLGGICGFIANSGSLTVSDSVLTGTLERSSYVSGGYGAVVGHLSSNGVEDVTISNVYIQTNIGATAYVGKDNSTGNTVVVPETYEECDLTGALAYTNTNLPFKINAADENEDNIWSARTEKGPILTRFAEESVLSLTSYMKADTRWYDNPQGNVGTEAAPYLLKDADDYYGFVSLVDGGNTFAGKYIQLACDITLNTNTPKDAEKLASWASYTPEFTMNTAGKGDTATAITDIVGFAGTLDGQNNSLSGVYINEATGWTGLLGYTTDTSVIKNIEIMNSYIKGAKETGGLVGRGNGDMSNVTSNAVVEATQYVGGLVGNMDGAQNAITDCTFTGTVNVSNASGYAGGLVGNIGTTSEHDMTRCTFDGILDSPSKFLGGLIGVVNGTSDVDVLGCVSNGTIRSSVATSHGTGTYIAGMFGRIIGSSNVDVQKSIFSGTVCAEGTTYNGAAVGGVANVNVATLTMSQVLVTGTITASQEVGGFVGNIYSSGPDTITMTDCHFDGTINALKNGSRLSAGALVGLSKASGKTVKITATRCLVTGKLNFIGTTEFAKLVGAMWYADSSFDGSGGVYIIDDDAKIPATIEAYLTTVSSSPGWAGEEGAGISEVTTANLTGAAAVNNVPLLGISTDSASDSTWVATKNGFPTLRYFAETTDIYTAQ